MTDWFLTPTGLIGSFLVAAALVLAGRYTHLWLMKRKVRTELKRFAAVVDGTSLKRQRVTDLAILYFNSMSRSSEQALFVMQHEFLRLAKLGDHAVKSLNGSSCRELKRSLKRLRGATISREAYDIILEVSRRRSGRLSSRKIEGPLSQLVNCVMEVVQRDVFSSRERGRSQHVGTGYGRVN